MLSDKVLLLGHRGLIGRILYSQLQTSGWDVVGASTDECDLLNEERCQAFFDAIHGECHVVMASVINRWVEDSHRAMTRNVAMMRNVCTQLAGHPPKSLVLLSTVDVYGTSPRLPVNEETRLAPCSYYALGKLACEFLPNVINQEVFPVTTLRLPGVYGTSPDEASMVARFLRTLASGGTVVIHGGHPGRRSRRGDAQGAGRGARPARVAPQVVAQVQGTPVIPPTRAGRRVPIGAAAR